jgi:DNA-binding Lrp family transcriptional regulator
MSRHSTQDFCVTTRTPVALDELDHRLLACLQQDAGQTLNQLGDTVGLSPSAVQRRMTRYRRMGLISRQIAVLDPDVLRSTVLAAVLVTMERESIRAHKLFRERMRSAPHVQQCYSLAGERDYLVIVTAGAMPDCRDAVDHLFMDDPNVKRYTTHVVFDVVKVGLDLPTSTHQRIERNDGALARHSRGRSSGRRA